MRLLKKAEGRRQKAEGSLLKGIGASPSIRATATLLDLGLVPRAPYQSLQGRRQSGIKTSILPSALCLLPCLVKLSCRAWQKTRIFSVIGLQMGLLAVVAGCSSNAASDTPSPISPVPAESVTAKEVADYAAAVLAIEPIRQEAYKEVQDNTKDEPVPDFTCTQADTIAALPTNLEQVAVKYCNQAKKIGEDRGFTMARFNQITATAQSDAILQQRIQNELQRLQNEQQPSQRL